MTLTAREAIQALLDGKTLRKGEVTIIPMEWGFQMQVDGSAYKAIILRDCEVVEEDMDYPLTFAQALRAMLDGKVVENSYKFGRYRFDKGFEYSSICDWQPCVMDVTLRNYKWKVIE